MSELTEVVKACNIIGRNKNLVQGAGGNISLKLDDRRMLVKASGLRLNEVTEERGIVEVDYTKISRFVIDDTNTEQTALDSILTILINDTKFGTSELRPSMETSFHALFGRAVVHTHPITTNLVTCMVDGYDVLRDIFNNLPFHWINYKSPGYFLSKEIKRKLICNGDVSVFFLEKHGLIVTSDDLEDCIRRTLWINKRIAEYFRIDEYKVESDLRKVDGGYLNDGDLVREFLDRYGGLTKYLFPDAVVYGKNPNVKFDKKGIFYGFDRKKSESVDEIMLANIYLLLTIPELGGRVNCLGEDDMNYLLDMGAEKYRREI